MTAIRKSGGGNVALTTLKRRAGGVEVAIQNGYRRSGGTWAKVYTAYTPVSATVNTTNVTASGSGSATSSPISMPTIAGPTAWGNGGSGAYTFAWEYVSGDARIGCGSPTASQTGFNSGGNSIPSGSTWEAVWRCKVSDGTSYAYTPNVNIQLSYDQTA